VIKDLKELPKNQILATPSIELRCKFEVWATKQKKLPTRRSKNWSTIIAIGRYPWLIAIGDILSDSSVLFRWVMTNDWALGSVTRSWLFYHNLGPNFVVLLMSP